MTDEKVQGEGVPERVYCHYSRETGALHLSFDAHTIHPKTVVFVRAELYTAATAKLREMEADKRRLDWLEGETPRCVWFYDAPDEGPSYFVAGEAPDDGPLGTGHSAREAIDDALAADDRSESGGQCATSGSCLAWRSVWL